MCGPNMFVLGHIRASYHNGACVVSQNWPNGKILIWAKNGPIATNAEFSFWTKIAQL